MWISKTTWHLMELSQKEALKRERDMVDLWTNKALALAKEVDRLTPRPPLKKFVVEGDDRTQEIEALRVEGPGIYGVGYRFISYDNTVIAEFPPTFSWRIEQES